MINQRSTPFANLCQSTTAHPVPVDANGITPVSALRKRNRSGTDPDETPAIRRTVHWSDPCIVEQMAVVSNSVAAMQSGEASNPSAESVEASQQNHATFYLHQLSDRDWILIDKLNRSTIDFIAGVFARQPDNPAQALTAAMGHFNPMLQFAAHSDRNGSLVRVNGQTISVLSFLMNHACRSGSSARLAESALIAEAVVAVLTGLHMEGRCYLQTIADLSAAARDQFVASRLSALQTLQEGLHLPRPDVFSPICMENVITQAQHEPMQAELADSGRSQCHP